MSHNNHNWFTSVLYPELESTVETKIKGQILQVFWENEELLLNLEFMA